MKNENSHESRAYQLKAGLQMRQFGLDSGIYDHERKQVFMLNPIAGLILNYLPTGKPYDEIIENIVIACGENTTQTDVIMNDLVQTVEEFIKFKLIEPVKDSCYELQVPLVISENEMTSLSIPYLPPQIKVYSMEELINKYCNNEDQKFGDTWNPDKGKVRFLDTYNPIQDGTRFLDTWNPDTGKVRFSDTWNPYAGNVIFSDTWNPKTDKTSLTDRGKLGSKPDNNPQGTSEKQ